MSWLKWVINYCLAVQFVLKVDDDVLVNIVEVVNLLRHHKVGNKPVPLDRSTLLCELMVDWRPHRHKKSKWSVRCTCSTVVLHCTHARRTPARPPDLPPTRVQTAVSLADVLANTYTLLCDSSCGTFPHLLGTFPDRSTGLGSGHHSVAVQPTYSAPRLLKPSTWERSLFNIVEFGCVMVKTTRTMKRNRTTNNNDAACDDEIGSSTVEYDAFDDVTKFAHR